MAELQGRHTVREYASVIAHLVRSGDSSRAYRAFLQCNDDLAAGSAAARVTLTVDPPESTGSRWDDALAALVELRLREVGAEVPAWALESVGHPDDLWEPQRSSFPLVYESDRANVPDAFRRRGVLLEAGELESV